jgi:hypothetical protein
MLLKLKRVTKAVLDGTGFDRDIADKILRSELYDFLITTYYQAVKNHFASFKVVKNLKFNPMAPLELQLALWRLQILAEEEAIGRIENAIAKGDDHLVSPFPESLFKFTKIVVRISNSTGESKSTIVKIFQAICDKLFTDASEKVESSHHIWEKTDFPLRIKSGEPSRAELTSF